MLVAYRADRNSGEYTYRVPRLEANECRVALARAVYGQFDSLVLDDPFSALDADTEAHVFSALFGTRGLLAGKMVVLATNQIHRLVHADYITILEHGRIAEQGTYDELGTAGGTLQMLVQEFAAGLAKRDTKEQEESVVDAAAHSSVHSILDGASTDNDAGETAHTGTVPRAVYALYLRGIGYVSAVFWISAIIVASVVQLTTGIYLQAWTGSLGGNTPEDRARYGAFLGGYTGMTIGYLVAFIGAIWNAFVISHPVASRRLHEWMIAGVLR